MVNLESCNRNCNTVDDPSSKMCDPNKIEYVNLNVFMIITRINANLMAEKVIRIKIRITINVNVSAKI